MIRIRGILFDKDGTLFDLHRSWFPLVKKAADIASGGDVELAEKLLSAGGCDLNSGCFYPEAPVATWSVKDVASLWVGLGAVLSRSKLSHAINKIYFRYGLQYASPVTDLKRFFCFLKSRKFKLGIATNDSKAAAYAAVKAYGLSDEVCFVAGYDSGFGPKPSPGMVFGFCLEAGLSADQVAVVGDSGLDMIMARLAAAGLKVGVLTGAGTRETLAKQADFIVDDITGLTRLALVSQGLR